MLIIKEYMSKLPELSNYKRTQANENKDVGDIGNALREISADLYDEYEKLPVRVKNILDKSQEIKSLDELREVKDHPLSGFMRFISPEDVSKLFAFEEKKDRFNREEYTEDDVETMPQEEIEMRAENLLWYLLYKTGFRDDFFDKDSEVYLDKFKRFLYSTWQNRTKDKIEYFYSDDQREIETNIQALEDEHKHLLEEEQRWLSKNNRPAKKKLQEVRQELLRFNSSAFMNDKYEELYSHKDKLEEIQSFHRKQDSLNHLLKRIDGIGYSVLLNQVLDRILLLRMKHLDKDGEFKDRLNRLREEVEEFAAKHGDDEEVIKPLSEDKIKTIEKLSDRLRVLLERMNLHEKGVSLSEEGDNSNNTMEDERQTIINELGIVLHLLNKISQE